MECQHANLNRQASILNILIKPLHIVYFFSILISFTSRIGNYEVNIYIKYLISIARILFFLIHISYKRNKNVINIIKRYFIYFAIPFIYIGLITLVIWLLKLDFEFAYFTRLISSILYYFLSISLPAIGFYFFGKKIINYIFFAMVFSYICFSFIPFVLTDSLFGLISSLLHFQEYGNTMLEVHDLVLTSGMTLVYFLFFEDKKEKFHKSKILLNIFLILAGFKRIVFLSLICVVLIVFIFKKIRRSKLKIFLTSGSTILMCFAFIYIVKSGILNDLVAAYGINTSGRIEMYNFACDYFDFSPFYIGTGFSRFTKMFEALYESGFALNGHRIPASIHSDVLSLYIELGFFGFLILILYITYIRPLQIRKLGSSCIVNLYLCLTIYMIILLLTDNVFNYFIFQSVYFSLPLSDLNINYKAKRQAVINKGD